MIEGDRVTTMRGRLKEVDR
jgi:hypothetical protein